MAKYSGCDLMLSSDGDLMLNENGDLATVSGPGFVIQSVYSRLKSVTVNWFYDNTGADLEDFLGRPNSRETAAAVTDRIRTTLTSDGLVSESELLVKATPLSRTVIGIFVFLKLEGVDGLVGFEVDVDLDGTVAVSRVS